MNTITRQLAVIEADIARTDGHVSLALLGPHECGHGPSPDGQLSVDIWQDDEPDQYFLSLQRDPAVAPEEFLLSAAQEFVNWLRAHGVRSEAEQDDVTLPVNDQLVITASFDAQEWRPA